MSHKLELEDSDGEEEHPRKRFEPDLDFDLDLGYDWEPTHEEYVQYERLMWQEEFRKLIEMDELSRQHQITADAEIVGGREETATASTSNVSEEDSDSQDSAMLDELQPVGSVGIVQHPLLLPEIIEHVMSFLDYHHDKETLENCLRVCPEWEAVAAKRLELLDSENSFSLSTKFADMKIMEEHLKRLPKHCHNFNIQLPPKRLPDMETVFKTVGPQVRELDVCFKIKDKHYPNPPIDHFGDYLEQYCPRLQKLKLWLSSSEHYPESIFSKEFLHFLPVRHIETEDFTDNPRTHIFEELIESSPFLESLTFRHESTELIVRMLNILAKRDRLRQLHSLQSYHFDVGDDFIAFALKHRWNLHSLKIAFKREVSVPRMRALLHHMRDTLVTVEILYKGSEYDTSLVVEDNWVVPRSMRKLKNLIISPNLFANACRFMVNALQLLTLKTFKITSSVSWSENYFETMWRRNRIIVDSLALKSLEIPCSCLDASIFLQNPNPFRNLKELVLDSPSIKVLQAVFIALTNLERLTIYELYSLSHYTWDDITTGYFSDLRGRPLMWDEILTGKKRPDYTVSYKSPAQPLMQAVPSICSLKNLKFLLLDFKSTFQKVSDFFIYHGLMHLTELQHVYINRHNFSEEAIQALKEKLAAFCYLEIEADSDYEEDMRG